MWVIIRVLKYWGIKGVFFIPLRNMIIYLEHFGNLETSEKTILFGLFMGLHINRWSLWCLFYVLKGMVKAYVSQLTSWVTSW